MNRFNRLGKTLLRGVCRVNLVGLAASLVGLDGSVVTPHCGCCLCGLVVMLGLDRLRTNVRPTNAPPAGHCWISDLEVEVRDVVLVELERVAEQHDAILANGV